MLKISHLNNLFDYLWPAMTLASGHKATCIEKLSAINNCFIKFKDDHDKLLASLSSLDGIGLTIASGLIWSYYPHNRVPFDKYTVTYAIDLKIIPSENISSNYTKYSEKIKEFCSEYIDYTIEDFVRQAMEEMQSKEYLISPK
jgi:hypothetical protein